jgi:two-component system cell cycle response regulator DivK
MAIVLVVEDNHLNLELVNDILESEGHGVLQASTAEEGIEIAKRELPDLILMDIRLPGLDGHSAVKLLKQEPQTSRIPTIALTAQAMTGDRETSIAAGFDGYIPKPISVQTFRLEVSRVLGARPAA